MTLDHGPVHRDAEPPAADGVIEHRSARQRRGRGQARITVNLTAMIDVTFLLLVYFMVATEFKLGEEVYTLDLPNNLQSDRYRDPFDLNDDPIRIEVASTGALGQDYRLRIDGPYPQPKTFEELYTFLDSKQIRPGAIGALFEPDREIIIIPARSARWEHAIAAFNAVARARYTSFKFGKPM